MSMVPARIADTSRLIGNWNARSINKPADQWIQRCVAAYQSFVSHSAIIPLSCLIIGIVAAYDCYLTIVYAETLHVYEVNPVGRWLMQLDINPVDDLQQVATFLAFKVLGTVLVITTLQLLVMWRRKLAGVVASNVAIFQLCLGLYLTF